MTSVEAATGQADPATRSRIVAGDYDSAYARVTSGLRDHFNGWRITADDPRGGRFVLEKSGLLAGARRIEVVFTEIETGDVEIAAAAQAGGLFGNADTLLLDTLRVVEHA